MPFIKVYVHFVWSTKNRVPFLHPKELRLKVWSHIRENSKSKGIFLDVVSRHSDHCHCLISMGTDQTIRKIMQLIKGESSFWINKSNLTAEKFEWQDEYFAVSVSESMLGRVRNYIMNQEEHHRKKSFQDEYIELLSKYKFERFEDS
jgi:putative transposase